MDVSHSATGGGKACLQNVRRNNFDHLIRFVETAIQQIMHLPKALPKKLTYDLDRQLQVVVVMAVLKT